MNIAKTSRRILINVGKVLPFAICSIVLLSYIETLYNVCNEQYAFYDGYITPSKALSYNIGRLFEYDIGLVSITLVISIAIETCLWNKATAIYLFFNLSEKYYFANKEVYKEWVCTICVFNILTCTYLLYNGVKKLKKI